MEADGGAEEVQAMNLQLRRRIRQVAASILLSALPVQALGQEMTSGNVDFYLGGKTLNGAEWGPADHESVVGLDADFRDSEWPLSVELGLQGATGQGTSGAVTTTSRTSEMFAGVKKIWNVAPLVRPYLDAGLAIVNGQLENSSPGAFESESDDTVGLWVGGGLYWTIQQAFNVGLGVRFEGAQVNLFGNDKNAGGAELNLLLGWHWGGRSA